MSIKTATKKPTSATIEHASCRRRWRAHLSARAFLRGVLYEGGDGQVFVATNEQEQQSKKQGEHELQVPAGHLEHCRTNPSVRPPRTRPQPQAAHVIGHITRRPANKQLTNMVSHTTLPTRQRSTSTARLRDDTTNTTQQHATFTAFTRDIAE